MRAVHVISLVWTAFLLAVIPRSSSAMDFTPRQGRFMEDGIPSIRTYFKDGNAEIFFRIMKGWRMAGGGNEVTLYPGAMNGYIRLGNSPVGAAVPFDEKGVDTYLQAARRMLPRHAEAVEIASKQVDAYPLDDWKSFEVQFTYELHGTKSVCWVLFITMTPDRQICYLVDGEQGNFEVISADSRQMLGSWFEPPRGLVSLTR